MARWLMLAALAGASSASADPVVEATRPPAAYATVSATMWWPREDMSGIAKTSPGFRGLFGYRDHHPWLSLAGAIDVVSARASNRSRAPS